MMDISLYLLLLILPLPLLGFIVKRKQYIYCLPPFVAFIGIYLFNIVGSIEVIKNEALFSETYYFSLLFIIISFYLFYAFLSGFEKKLYIDWSATHLTQADNFSIFLVILWSYSFFMFFLYWQRHGLPAVFQISLSEINNLYAIRAEKSTNLAEGGHWYWLAFSTIPAFIFIYSYILKRLSRTQRAKYIFYLNLPLVLFFSSLTLHKTPFAYLVLYLLLVNFFLDAKALEFKKLLKYFAIGTGTIIGMLRLYLLDRGFIDVLKLVPYFLYRRICISYTMAHAYILKIFPSQHAFFGGIAFGNPGHIFPYKPVNLSQFLGYWIDGRVENYSAPSFSQGYANFGLWGFISIIILIFLQILFIQIVFKKCPKNPLFMTLYILIIPTMLGYSNASILSIVSEIFILFSIACIFAYYLSKAIVINLGQKNKLPMRKLF